MQISVLSDVAVSPNMASRDRGVMCAFVQMTLADKGDATCVYRRGSQKHGPDGALVLQRSGDGGQTWQPPVTVFDRTDRTPPETVICGGICAIGDSLVAAFCSVEMLDPEVYVFSEEADGFPRHINVSRSEDQGRTWSPPSRIPTPDFAARTGVASSPFVLANGDLCVPLESQLKTGPQGTAASFSSDGGQTFSPPQLLVGDAAAELSLCDARFARLRDGTHLMHLWSFRYDTEETVNVHESRSADGRVWSAPQPTTIQGQISQPLHLPSGLLVTVCNHRQSPMGSQLWWSMDEGATWNERPIQMWDAAAQRVTGAPAAPRVASTDEDVWDALPKFAFGTPNLARLDDGVLLLSYWATIDDVVHVRACRFRITDAPVP